MSATTARLVDVEGRRISLTNLDKVLWPRTGTTKAELIEHHLELAPVLLLLLHLARSPAWPPKAIWSHRSCPLEPRPVPGTGRGRGTVHLANRRNRAPPRPHGRFSPGRED